MAFSAEQRSSLHKLGVDDSTLDQWLVKNPGDEGRAMSAFGPSPGGGSGGGPVAGLQAAGPTAPSSGGGGAGGGSMGSGGGDGGLVMSKAGKAGDMGGGGLDAIVGGGDVLGQFMQTGPGQLRSGLGNRLYPMESALAGLSKVY